MADEERPFSSSQPPAAQPGRTIYFISGLVLVCVLTLMAMLILEPIRNKAEPTPVGVLPTMTPVVEQRATPLPAEFMENQYLTNGIVFGATLMIVLVVGVTLAVLIRTSKPPGATG